jgi:hypothetical protein
MSVEEFLIRNAGDTVLAIRALISSIPKTPIKRFLAKVAGLSLILMFTLNSNGISGSVEPNMDTAEMLMKIRLIKRCILAVGTPNSVNELKNPDKLHELATIITRETERFGLNSKVMVAIMRQESNFTQAAVSSSGDVSIAQINLKVWAPVLKSHNVSIDVKRLKKDKAYAIGLMAWILKINKKNHSGDPRWFLYYHSNKKVFQSQYFSRLKPILKKLTKVS